MVFAPPRNMNEFDSNLEIIFLVNQTNLGRESKEFLKKTPSSINKNHPTDHYAKFKNIFFLN